MLCSVDITVQKFEWRNRTGAEGNEEEAEGRTTIVFGFTMITMMMTRKMIFGLPISIE